MDAKSLSEDLETFVDWTNIKSSIVVDLTNSLIREISLADAPLSIGPPHPHPNLYNASGCTKEGPL